MPIKSKDGTEYSLSRYEQEVHIYFNAEESTARIHSTNPVWNRKLDKLCAELPDTYKRLRGPNGIDDDWREYLILDKNLISLRKPREYKPTEARKAAIERLRASRNKI